MRCTLPAVFSLLLLSFLVVYPSSAQDGAITGRITLDDSGGAFEGAEIMALGNGKTFYGFSGADGSYDIDVPDGTYLVGVRVVTDGGLNVYTEYYDDEATMMAATLLTVDAGEVISEINFGVPDLPNVISAGGFIMVSGIVTDAVTGNPLGGATVIVGDYGREVLEPDTAFTDTGGAYSIELPSYAQRLMAWTFAPGYDLQFYDRQPSPTVASEIIVNPDEPTIDGIDFELLPRSQGSAGKRIIGSVKDAEGNPLQSALVIAFNAGTAETRYALTSSTGAYSLGGLDGGSYYVLAAAAGFIPEFYGGTQSWNDASTVEADGITSGIHFMIGGLNRPPIGKGLDAGENGTATALSGHALRLDGGPVDLAVVLVTDVNGNIVAFDLTDRSGYFEIEGLPAGSYTVRSDRVQYEGDERPAELAVADHYVQTSTFLTMANASATSRDEDRLPTRLLLEQNYPNPFNPQTLISYTLPRAGDVDLAVFDVLGRRIATLVSGPQPSGTHSVRFDAAADVAGGVYFYRLRAAGREITRAMLLVK